LSEFKNKKNITPKRFKEIIKRGLGSAILILKSISDVAQYKKVVLWATLNDTVYDRLFEAYRGEYLFEIISYFNDNHYFEVELIKKYSAKRHKENEFKYLTNVLYCFAQNGSTVAKETLYAKYNELCSFTLNNKRQLVLRENQTIEQKMLEEICIWLTSLEDFNAFKKIVIDLKQYYLQNQGKKYFEYIWFFENAIAKFGEKRVLNYLQGEGIFYEPYDYEKASPPQKPLLLQEVIAFCNKKLSWQERFSIRKFGRTATNEELTAVMQCMVSEKNLDTKANYLAVFKDVSFSLEILDIKNIIECSKMDNRRLKANAYYILEKNICKEVYEYAVELIGTNIDLDYAIELLCKKFKKSDAELLSNAVKKLKISYASVEWHGAFMAVNSLIRENKNAPSELLEYLYEQTLCSDCREDIVKNIVKRKLPCLERILNECEYDCNYDLRTFAIKTQKKNLHLK